MTLMVSEYTKQILHFYPTMSLYIRRLNVAGTQTNPNIIYGTEIILCELQKPFLVCNLPLHSPDSTLSIDQESKPT